MAPGIAELDVTTFPRLSSETLSAASKDVILPNYAREKTRIGHVHLGAGAFMRAHIAVYNDTVMNASGGDWGIAGVSLRHATVKDQLRPQDGLYNVASSDVDKISYRTIGSLLSVDAAPDDPKKIVQLIAHPDVHVVSLTVTEKGYSIDPASGSLDTTLREIANDLKKKSAPESTLGFLTAGLTLRCKQQAGPVTLISCDNLADNGSRLRLALYDFVDIAAPQLKTWIDDNVCFPTTMVDRIVPATTPADIDRAAVEIGLIDKGLVKAEPFMQWVIQDHFAGPRPDWGAAGALLVDNVKPYETAKLRLLNGSHSALAYLGYLAGVEYVHEAMCNQHYAAYLRHLMTREISPATPEPEGMQHSGYIEELLKRFRNGSLKHRTWQIAMDGSQKLPQRILNTVRTQLKNKGPIAGLSLVIAAWIQYTQGLDERGLSIDVRDPLAHRFENIRGQVGRHPENLVTRYLEIDAVFGDDLARDPRFASTVASQLRSLFNKGVVGTVVDYVETCGN